MADTFANGESKLSVRNKLNSNAGEIDSNISRLEKLEDVAYANFYSSVETLAMIANTPQSPTGSIDKGSIGFDTSGGNLKREGTPIKVKITGGVSMESTTNNVVVSVSIAKNSVIDTDTELSDKILTGSDIRSFPVSGVFDLNNGDYLDFFIETDKSTNITIQKGNFTIVKIKDI